MQRLRRLLAAASLGTALLVACGGGSGASGNASTPPPAGQPPVGTGITGLDFPSNSDSPTNAFVAFQFLNPQNSGLPFWGPNNAGVTYLWRYRPRHQAGYYVTLWWSNNGRFEWNGGQPDTYYGAHPYPRGGGAGTTVHDWEIGGMDFGTDFTETLAGAPKPVVKDRWYSQALHITVDANGTRRARFYIDLPSTAPGDVIEAVAPAGFGNTLPPAPALTFGDSPWFADYQHERLSGVLRGIKIFSRSLSLADLQAEAASDTLATSQGVASVWYMNINPTPDDISDKSGAGHHPAWAEPARRAALWSQ